MYGMHTCCRNFIRQINDLLSTTLISNNFFFPFFILFVLIQKVYKKIKVAKPAPSFLLDLYRALLRPLDDSSSLRFRKLFENMYHNLYISNPFQQSYDYFFLSVPSQLQNRFFAILNFKNILVKQFNSLWCNFKHTVLNCFVCQLWIYNTKICLP